MQLRPIDWASHIPRWEASIVERSREGFHAEYIDSHPDTPLLPDTLSSSYTVIHSDSFFVTHNSKSCLFLGCPYSPRPRGMSEPQDYGLMRRLSRSGTAGTSTKKPTALRITTHPENYRKSARPKLKVRICGVSGYNEKKANVCLGRVTPFILFRNIRYSSCTFTRLIGGKFTEDVWVYAGVEVGRGRGTASR